MMAALVPRDQDSWLLKLRLLLIHLLLQEVEPRLSQVQMMQMEVHSPRPDSLNRLNGPQLNRLLHKLRAI